MAAHLVSVNSARPIKKPLKEHGRESASRTIICLKQMNCKGEEEEDICSCDCYLDSCHVQ